MSEQEFSQLDIEDGTALVAYLRVTGRIAADETPTTSILPGGVSNRTVLVERSTGEAWVIKQALAKLRVPTEWYSPVERVHREALGLIWLARLAPSGTIPALIFEDHTAHLVAMQAVPQPHENWKTLLLEGQLDFAHVDQFAWLLAAIHAHAYTHHSDLAPIFADRSFFESLRLEPYYGYTATQVEAAAHFLQKLMAATRERQITLVHGDYSPKNILVHEGRLVLLDHEVIHWGDPAFDLGFAMTHLLSKANYARRHEAGFAVATRRFWSQYQAQIAHLPWAAELERFAIQHTLACLLARVAGRSPLEYLAPAQRQRQHNAVLALMAAPPSSIAELTTRFLARPTS